MIFPGTAATMALSPDALKLIGIGVCRIADDQVLVGVTMFSQRPKVLTQFVDALLDVMLPQRYRSLAAAEFVVLGLRDVFALRHFELAISEFFCGCGSLVGKRLPQLDVLRIATLGVGFIVQCLLVD